MQASTKGRREEREKREKSGKAKFTWDGIQTLLFHGLNSATLNYVLGLKPHAADDKNCFFLGVTQMMIYRIQI